MTTVTKLLLAKAKVRTRENESFVINNYQWVPKSASDEESEEEQFDLLKQLDKETSARVRKSPLSSPSTIPAPNPGSPPPALPPRSTSSASPLFDTIRLFDGRTEKGSAVEALPNMYLLQALGHFL